MQMAVWHYHRGHIKARYCSITSRRWEVAPGAREAHRTAAEWGEKKGMGNVTSSFRDHRVPDSRCSNEEKKTKIQRGYQERNLTEDYFAVSAIFTEHTKQAGHITDQHRQQLWGTQEKMKQNPDDGLPGVQPPWGRCRRGTFHL